MLDIIQLSDSHITDSREFVSSAFSRAVEYVRKKKPDLVIHNGDITQSGLREDYELATDMLKGLGKDVVYLIGNHDARNVGYELYEEYIGEREDFYENEHYFLSVIDSTKPDTDDGKFSRGKIRNLMKRLKEVPEGKTKILAFHHHLLPVPKSGRERNVIADAGDVLEMVHSYDIDIVLNGHRHYPTVYRVGGTVISIAGSIGARKLRAGDDHSLNHVRVHDDGAIDVDIVRFAREGGTKVTPRKIDKPAPRFYPLEGKRILRIIQISDTHITHERDYREELAYKALGLIRGYNPDLVVHNGDLTHNGLPGAYKNARRFLDEIPAPTLVVPGSHDLLHLGTELFEEVVGPLYPRFENDNMVAIGVNTAQFDDPMGVIGRDGLRITLEKLREIPEEKLKVLVMHHHIVPLPRTREGAMIENAGDSLRAFTDINLPLILTGHKHITYAVQVENTTIVNAGTVSSRRVQSRYGNTMILLNVLENGVLSVSEVQIATGVVRPIGVYRLPWEHKICSE